MRRCVVAAVLVVDDDVAIGRLVALRLGAGHAVELATSAQQALDRITAGRRFDTIFCDLNMPNMSGLDMCAAIAHIDPEQARRVVFMTAGVRSVEETSRLAALPNRCMEKPLDLNALHVIVDGFLPIRMRDER